MRNRLMIGTAALLLVSATFAGAQATPQQETTPSQSGTIDVGGRFTSTDGDEARYERYRALQNGVNANFLFSKETKGWTFDFLAKNIGYEDGRYVLNFNSSKWKITALFDQTPTNYAYYTRTPYNCSGGNCSLDANLRSDVENRRAIGVWTTPAQMLVGSSYNSIARTFDLESRRDTIAAEVRYSATDNLDFIVGVNTYSRTGNMPWGASFAFPIGVELPLEIDNRETDWLGAVEWASHQGMSRFEYQHQKFEQNIPDLRFDNPNRATDFCRTGISGQPPGTCWDPSGYTNGNGPAYGRMALPPSNSVDRFNWMGMIKLPARTTANASLGTGINRQDNALIPWTTNSTINNEATWAAFPELRHLPRETSNMHVNYFTGTANVSSRAIKNLNLTGRYRHNSRTDFTHEFDAVEYVRFDAVPEETGGITHALNISRNTFDADATFTGISRTAIRAGYGVDKWEHTHRTTEGFQDNVARLSFDFVGNQWLTLRAQYKHIDRDVTDLSIEALEEGGMQPAARFYDEAARKGYRTSLVAEVMPTSSLGLNFTMSRGKDDYKEGDPTQEFGLLDNENTAWTAGVTYAPSTKVNLGADYGRETFSALQESRSANPAPDPTWTDPNRNWTLSNDETVNTFSAYVDLLQALAKTDIRAAYTYSDSDQAFAHGGPRIASLSAPTAAAPNGTFVALPNVTNTWQQFTVDVSYSLSKNFGLGLYYLFEKFEVEDWATINSAGPQTLPNPALGAQTDTPRIDWFGGLTTGYGNRPYSGHTAIVRLFYHF
jgi:hypothetical protein